MERTVPEICPKLEHAGDVVWLICVLGQGALLSFIKPVKLTY